MLLLEKQQFLAKIILRADAIKCQTHVLFWCLALKNNRFYEFEISLHKDYCVEMLSICSHEKDNLIFRFSTQL
jgi:hypothetical protein